MEHSVQAYLERRSTVELMNFLEMRMLRNDWDQYADTVPDIFALLKKRKAQVPERVTNSWNVFIDKAQKP